MPTTSNFGWNTPADTDLVKDGALAIRTLGNNIDASMAELKGGTTGQVLSKTSNTDMDFTWVTQDDANAIQNAIVDAKGDLIAATANDTPARLAVGSNGDTLVADSAATTGLRWQPDFSVGRNKIINADFRIAQRGTSFTNPAGGIYTLDRYTLSYDGSGATRVISQQTFTPGAAPVAGYEGQSFYRFNQSVAGTGGTFNNALRQPVEDVRTFAGQTITISAWIKADATRTVTAGIGQVFGSGGSGSVYQGASSWTVGTSWTRYSATITVPSISGKTIGTNSYLDIYFAVANNTVQTIDIWGLQAEAGSVATAFQTATGTLQGELAACQRYYYRVGGSNAYEFFAFGVGYSTTNGIYLMPYKSTLRTNPSAVDYASLEIKDPGTGSIAITSLTIDNTGNNQISLNAAVASGLISKRPYFIRAAGTTSGYIGLSAEL